MALAASAPANASQCVDLDEGVFGPGGTLCVDPVGMIVTSNGIITFTLTVGSKGFAENGLVQIEFPAAGRGMSPPREVDAGTNGHIEGLTSVGGVGVTATNTPALSAIAQFRLVGGGLTAGDQIVMQYTTVMPKVAGTIYWRFRTNRDADPYFEPDNTGGRYLGPGFVIQGEQAAYVQLTAPGDVVVGVPFTVGAASSMVRRCNATVGKVLGFRLPSLE